MIDRNDWLSRQIGLHAIDNFLEEQSKNVEPILIKRSDGKYTYIKEDGTLLVDKWFTHGFPFKRGEDCTFVVGENDEWFIITVDGKLYPRNHIWFPSCGRGIIYDEDEKNYHFVDYNGKTTSDSYHNANKDRYGQERLEYRDGFATVMKHRPTGFRMMDINGNILPESKDDSLFNSYEYCGYGYYFVGKLNKPNGYKLKDANTGIVLDNYYYWSGWADGLIEKTKMFLAMIGKLEPNTMNIFLDEGGFRRQSGILLIGNYWFLGSSNLKVTKKGNTYHSISPFGEFDTKYPPIKAIDEEYLLCAHNGQVYVYDVKTGTYGKSCTAKEVRDYVKIKMNKIRYIKMAQNINALTKFLAANKGMDVKIIPSYALLLHSPDSYGVYLLNPAVVEFPELLNKFDLSKFDRNEVFYEDRCIPFIHYLKKVEEKIKDNKELPTVEEISDRAKK